MTFYPDDKLVPQKLNSDDFILHPLTPDHVIPDYAALMSSKEMLRLWSGSSWPNDDFTLAENLENLKWHWDEHQKRIAFTFTILNPAEDACLGCIYIKPLTEILAHNPEWKMTASASSVIISPHSALARFWVVEPTLAQELDKTLLLALRRWFTAEWAFSEIFWHTPANNQQQITLFQSNGLQKLGRIHMPDRGGDHVLFK